VNRRSAGEDPHLTALYRPSSARVKQVAGRLQSPSTRGCSGRRGRRREMPQRSPPRYPPLEGGRRADGTTLPVAGFSRTAHALLTAARTGRSALQRRGPGREVRRATCPCAWVWDTRPWPNSCGSCGESHPPFPPAGVRRHGRKGIAPPLCDCPRPFAAEYSFLRRGGLQGQLWLRCADQPGLHRPIPPASTAHPSASSHGPSKEKRFRRPLPWLKGARGHAGLMH